MQAIIKQGSKQYIVKENDIITVDRTSAEKLKPEILAIFSADKIIIGTPVVKDAAIETEIINDQRSDKIYVYKYKSKVKYRRKIGARQEQTIIKIKSIKA